jgi:tetratricopeptide (TPR) repeat protein
MGCLRISDILTAHENDAERAILAGLAILKAIGTLKAAADVAVQTRIAIGSGVVVVGDLMREGVTQENAAIGETTNLVARLQAIAEPNSLVISPVTHRLVGALFDYRDLGRHTLKGFREPVHVRQVLGPSKIESRFEAQHQAGTSPLLGREEELELLLRRWEQAKRREGRVVLVTGEPGIGKSRLARTIRDRLTSDPHTSLSYYCSPHHQSSALYPHTMQLTRAAGIERDDSTEVRLGKIKSLLAQSSGNLDQDMPLISTLVSIPGGDRYPLPEMTPQRRKERTLAALLDQLKQLAARQPVLVVYEDLHWIDPTSLELLSLAIEQVRDQRILLLATARPEFTPPWPRHWHVTMLSLNRFSRYESEALIAGVTKGKVLPPQVRDQIVTQTDGVPLFVEELTKTVLESGLLREASDHYELTGPLPPLAIPSTLHASLLARLDRLAAVKDVAQLGAVIGREFSYALIAAAAALPEKELNDALSQLVAAELIYQRGVPPDATYQFKHALVQDASYASLVRSRRQLLHGQIARALEERFPDIVATEPETLAHHLTEAALMDSAIAYWLKAGERAIRSLAFFEAGKHLSKGIELIPLLPASKARDTRELTLLLHLGNAFRVTKGYGAPETVQINERAHNLFGSASTLAEKNGILVGVWQARYGRAEHIAARELAEENLALVTQHGDIRTLAHANRILGFTLCVSGELLKARHHLELSGDLTDRMEAIKPFATNNGSDIFGALGRGGDKAFALSYLSWTLWLLGYPEQGGRTATRVLAHAQPMRDANPYAFGMALHAQVRLSAFGADPEQATVLSDEMVTHCAKHRLANFEQYAKFHRAHLLSLRGDITRGIEDMLMVEESIPDRLYRTQHLGLIADAYARLGQSDVCLKIIEDALQTVEQTNERFVEAELYRQRGAVLLKMEQNDKALIALLRALDIARRQEARWWELRAATTLARHWRSEDRHADAYNVLEPVYNWFTEGFDTRALKATKVLLEELEEGLDRIRSDGE